MDKTKEQSQDKRWTDEQIQAIEDKGANLLISAAAGSGKTTVLIERIVRKILNDGVNVDEGGNYRARTHERDPAANIRRDAHQTLLAFLDPLGCL